MKPTVHLYTFCFNEEDMIPYFLRHYEQFVDRFFIYDNGSSDLSLSLLREHPKVEVRKRFTWWRHDNVRFTRDKNNLWKQSRGKADFVIVCDMDEFLVHPKMDRLLEEAKANGTTILKPEGFQMVSRHFPSTSNQIYDAINTGRRETIFDKTVLFDPNNIDEIGFEIGSHISNPSGNVHLETPENLKLLHYSFIDLERVRNRFLRSRKRLSLRNRIRPWSTHYKWNNTELSTYFEKLIDESGPVQL